jgi:hypothetical protein
MRNAIVTLLLIFCIAAPFLLIRRMRNVNRRVNAQHRERAEPAQLHYVDEVATADGVTMGKIYNADPALVQADSTAGGASDIKNLEGRR